MSSTMSQELRIMLTELFAAEKEDTRVWLRAEMDRFVDPMLHSIFNRLTNKLMELDRIQSGNECAQAENPFEQEELSNTEVHRPVPIITQPSTLNQQYCQPHSISDDEYDQEILAEVKREIEEEREMQLNMQHNPVDNPQLTQVEGEQSVSCPRAHPEQEHCHPQFQIYATPIEYPQYSELLLTTGQMANGNKDSAQLVREETVVKEEFDDTTTEFSIDNTIANLSSEEENEKSSLSETESMSSGLARSSQTLQQLNGQVDLDSLSDKLSTSIANEQSNQNLVNLDEEEERDCGDCVNGEIDRMINEDDGDWFEDNIEVEDSSRPVKRPRLDTTPPHNAQAEVIEQCPRQPTQPNQMNNHNNRYITVSLQCSQLDCFDKFPEDQLNDHMWDKHLIGRFQCLLKNCDQSFDNMCILSYHIKHVHKHTTKWHCDKCQEQFKTYNQLSWHNTQLHQLGHFKCSFAACTFMGECRMKVYNHYHDEHNKPTLNSHIRLMTHLELNPSSVPKRLTQLESKDYVEVVNELFELNQHPADLPNQVNDLDKQIITISLQCPESDCLEMFVNGQLNRHMWEKHLIGPFRCLVKYCGESFDNNDILGDHIKQVHLHTTEWHCSKCSKHFITYQLLFCHYTNHHQLGQFHCSFPACTFTGECRVKVFNHYAQQHKQTNTELSTF